MICLLSCFDSTTIVLHSTWCSRLARTIFRPAIRTSSYSAHTKLESHKTINTVLLPLCIQRRVVALTEEACVLQYIRTLLLLTPSWNRTGPPSNRILQSVRSVFCIAPDVVAKNSDLQRSSGHGLHSQLIYSIIFYVVNKTARFALACLILACQIFTRSSRIRS